MTEPGGYTGDTRDHMTLRANGDLTIAAAGAFAALCYDRSWEEIMQDSGEMARKAVTIESAAGQYLHHRRRHLYRRAARPRGRRGWPRRRARCASNAPTRRA